MAASIPSRYLTLHDAMARIGAALVPGWAGEEMTFPAPQAVEDAPDVIKSEVDLSPGGITWIDREYDEHLWGADAPRLSPSSPTARECLNQVITMMRDWVDTGGLPLLFATAAGYEPVPFKAVITDDRIFMTGRYWVEWGPGEVVVVRKAELDGVLRALTPSPADNQARANAKDEWDARNWLLKIMDASPGVKTAGKKALEARYKTEGGKVSGRGFERAWASAASEHPEWSAGGRLSKPAPRE